MAETKLVIPEGQSIRFTPVTYHLQPTGSQFYNYQAPQNRHYDNTRHLQEVDYNQQRNLSIYPYSYGTRKNYPVQQLKYNDILYLFWRSQLTMVGINTLKAYDLAGTLLATLNPLANVQYNDASYQVIYENVKLTGDGTYTYVYFETGTVNEYYPYEYYLYGNIPPQYDLAIENSWNLTGSGLNNFSNLEPLGTVYIEALNVFAIQFQHPYNVGTTTGDLQFSYKRSDFGFYGFDEVVLPSTLLNKCFYLEIEHNITDDDSTSLGKWRSDLLYLSLDMTVGMVKFQWKNVNSFGMIDYRLQEAINTMYLQADYFDLMLDSDQFTAETERGGLTNFNPIYKRRFKTRAEFLPRHLVDLLRIATMHDYFYMNGKRFTIDLTTFEIERIERTMLYNVTFEAIEYEINGIYSANYEFNRLVDGRQHALLIDADDFLDIGGGNRLEITET